LDDRLGLAAVQKNVLENVKVTHITILSSKEKPLENFAGNRFKRVAANFASVYTDFIPQSVL
jgi:hypothetical protein